MSPSKPTRPTIAALALANANVHVGTVDGRLIALDMRTGKPVWDTRLVDSKKLTVGFTGAPLAAKDTIIKSQIISILAHIRALEDKGN